MQFTLLLTIGMVVMVIFVFLRSFWATVIPSITVPLALLGSAALMWAASYSLDNLSLMAFTIAVGFVVDDAIVMLENITRHIEAGMKPFEAALKGAGEIGFTIVSISVSLIAVLIPLLLMSGIIGRLFREFAVTIAMTIFVSALVSLTLTPMMASRFMKSHDEERHGRLYKFGERMFQGLANGYARALDFVLGHQFATLLVFLATVAATVHLFAVIPKGFFPQQDTGMFYGYSEAGQDVSFAEMVAAAGATRRDRAGRPRRRHDRDGARRRRRQRGAEQRDHVRNPEAARGTRRRRVPDDRALASQARRRQRREALPASGAGCKSRRALLAHPVPIHDPGRQSRRAQRLGAENSRQAQDRLPELRDVASDQQVAGTTLQLKIDRDMASRFGIQPQLIDDTLYDAFGQRQVAQYFTQVNTYEVVEEITPALQRDPATLNKIYIRAPTTGQMVPLSAFAKWTTNPVAPLSISHQGQFPAVTISFNLGCGVALGQATAAIQKAERELQMPRSVTTAVPGQRAGVPGFVDDGAAADPRRADHRLSHSRHAL